MNVLCESAVSLYSNLDDSVLLLSSPGPKKLVKSKVKLFSPGNKTLTLFCGMPFSRFVNIIS